MLDKDPAKRPSASEVLRNEYIAQNLAVRNYLAVALSILSCCDIFFYSSINNSDYYMAVSPKDWELPNSRIWLAELDIYRGLDFPI